MQGDLYDKFNQCLDYGLSRIELTVYFESYDAFVGLIERLDNGYFDQHIYNLE